MFYSATQKSLKMAMSSSRRIIWVASSADTLLMRSMLLPCEAFTVSADIAPLSSSSSTCAKEQPIPLNPAFH